VLHFCCRSLEYFELIVLFTFSQDVVIIATRRIVRPPKKGSAVQHPRTRTLTVVHDGILEDVVYPTEIVSKCVRYRLDGAKIMKVFCCFRVSSR
jgi:hypothetical protein